MAEIQGDVTKSRSTWSKVQKAASIFGAFKSSTRGKKEVLVGNREKRSSGHAEGGGGETMGGVQSSHIVAVAEEKPTEASPLVNPEDFFPTIAAQGVEFTKDSSMPMVARSAAPAAHETKSIKPFDFEKDFRKGRPIVIDQVALVCCNESL